MSTTNTEITATIENAADEKEENVGDTIFELGFAWAAYGLKIATTAVGEAARVLGITAQQLDKLSSDFAAKSGGAAKEVATK